MSAILSVRDLEVRYAGAVGCAGVSFDLYRGEILGVVGESGSGKSSVLNALAFGVTPAVGRARLLSPVRGWRWTSDASTTCPRPAATQPPGCAAPELRGQARPAAQ